MARKKVFEVPRKGLYLREDTLNELNRQRLLHIETTGEPCSQNQFVKILLNQNIPHRHIVSPKIRAERVGVASVG